MTGELNEDVIFPDGEDIETVIFDEAKPSNLYTSAAIKKIVDKHIAGIRKSSLILEGISISDIEYDNPEVHPQMMMDNLKDAGVRLELATKELQTLTSLTTERRKQLSSHHPELAGQEVSDLPRSEDE